MSGNTTSNTDPAIRAVVHSELILKQLEEGFLPEGLHRDVGDFGDGSLLQIPTLGEMTLHDILEEQDTPLSALDTGTVTLTITEHVGTGGYITDELKEDGYKAAAVEAEIVPSSLRAIKEKYETDLLAQANKQTLGDANVFADAAHRVIASGTNDTLELEDIAYLKFAFDQARIPDEGRILIVDPIVEMSLNSDVAAQAFTNNPAFEGMVTEGFAKSRRFVRHIYGFDIWTSTRLPRVDSESITYGTGVVPPVGASGSVTDAVANIAMCVADDMVKPFMGAWRRMPRVEGHRNVSKRRDEYHVTARWGFGVQREESLAVLLTSRLAYK